MAGEAMPVVQKVFLKMPQLFVFSSQFNTGGII